MHPEWALFRDMWREQASYREKRLTLAEQNKNWYTWIIFQRTEVSREVIFRAIKTGTNVTGGEWGRPGYCIEGVISRGQCLDIINFIYIYIFFFIFFPRIIFQVHSRTLLVFYHKWIHHYSDRKRPRFEFNISRARVAHSCQYIEGSCRPFLSIYRGLVSPILVNISRARVAHSCQYIEGSCRPFNACLFHCLG